MADLLSFPLDLSYQPEENFCVTLYFDVLQSTGDTTQPKAFRIFTALFACRTFLSPPFAEGPPARSPTPENAGEFSSIRAFTVGFLLRHLNQHAGSPSSTPQMYRLLMDELNRTFGAGLSGHGCFDFRRVLCRGCELRLIEDPIYPAQGHA